MSKPRPTRRPTHRSADGRYHFTEGDAPHLAPLHVLSEMRRWNQPLFELPNPHPHVALQVLHSPEGVLALARCLKCGGRHETLIDLRLPADVTDEANAEAMLNSRAQDAAAPILELWVPDHAACDHHPKTYHLPSEIVRRIDHRLTRATKRLRAGREVLSVIDLLLEDGRIMELPVNDLPERTAEVGECDRVMEVALRHFMVREWQREHGVEVRAAVLVGEAWAIVDHPVRDDDASLSRYPSLAHDRREVIQVCAITSSMGVVGISEIHRRGGRIGEGRGTFTRPELTMHTGASLLLDGLLATSIAY